MVNIDLDALYSEDADLLARAIKAMRAFGYTDDEINEKIQQEGEKQTCQHHN